MQIQRIVAYFIALVGFHFELRCYTQGKWVYGFYESPIVWFVSALMVAGGLFWANQMPATPIKEPKYKLQNLIVRYVMLAAMLVVLVHTWWDCLPYILTTFKIDPVNSDVIPSFQKYATRWLSGDNVYAPLKFLDWVVYPTYLPAMWFPYVFAELAHIDYRILPAILFTLYALWHGWQLVKSNTVWWIMAIELAIFPWLIYKMTFFRRDDFGMSLEITPAVFYLILGWTLLKPNPIKIGVAITLCLLSRYSFSFWLPAMLLIWWMHTGFKKPAIAGLTTAILVCLLYVFPFLIKNSDSLKQGFANYDRAAFGLWSFHSYQPDAEIYPHHLSQGLSFSLWFWKPTKGSSINEFTLAKHTHLALCLLTALLLVLVYWWKRRNVGSWNLYALAGLKLYFAVFYGFLYAPFSYLFQVPLLLSLVVLAAIRSR